jgi:hypothetical protein
MMRLVLLATVLFSFVACAGRQPVTLRHPNTGAVVQCGGGMNFILGPEISYQQERDCIADYQRAGYERAPR